MDTELDKHPEPLRNITVSGGSEVYGSCIDWDPSDGTDFIPVGRRGKTGIL